MNTKFHLLLTIISLSIVASCNPVAGGKKESKFGENFKPGLPSNNDEPTAPQAPVGRSTGFKVTSGAGRLAGLEGSAKASVLVNDRKLVGGQISGRFSINKTQVR